jgi:carboxyl-terminal processing protease
MRRRLFPVPILILIVGIASTAVAVRPATAQTSDPTALDVVRGTYDTMLDRFYAPLDPAALLSDGWASLQQELHQVQAPAAPALPPLPADREGAFAAFSGVYRAYVAALPEGITAPMVAYQVSFGITQSPGVSHTNFLSPAVFKNVLNSLRGGSVAVGLGLSLSRPAPHFVVRLAPGGPAERAGVMLGDTVITVDGKDVTSASPQDMSRSLLGNEGTTATLGLLRAGQNTDITVTRGRFFFPPLTAGLLPGGVGYLKLDQFITQSGILPTGGTLLDQLDADLDGFDAQGATGLVLDLRGNSGGSGQTAAEILGRFLPEDTLTLTQYDARGHASSGIVSGLMRQNQLPMAVIVDGNSASASEVVASVLKETNRAVLVGTKTAGALLDSDILPLPEGAGIQIAVAQVVTPYDQVTIEGQGYPVDVSVEDTRTADDYRLGNDPQLEAAVAALAQAPAPPAFNSTTTGFSTQQLTDMLAPYMPAASQIPVNDRISGPRRSGAFAANHVNEAIGLSARDPLALQQVLRRRGWLGSYGQSYDASISGASVGVGIDVYATPEGAADALATNDTPDVQTLTPSPIQLGDQAVALNGSWLLSGVQAIEWRHGNVVITVSYADIPGFEQVGMAEIIAVAKLVDQIYAANPLPALVPAPVSRLIGTGALREAPSWDQGLARAA